ncbi:MAG: hypothetical protein ACKVWR_22840, partial [Acidimicrobiales bacterium]
MARHLPSLRPGARPAAERAASGGAPLLWVLRVVWLLLPAPAGAALADALSEASRPVALTASVLAWAWWGATLFALLLPRPVTLAWLRAAAPVAAPAAVWAGANQPDGFGPTAALAVCAAAAAGVLALTAPVADAFVDGASYG